MVHGTLDWTLLEPVFEPIAAEGRYVAQTPSDVRGVHGETLEECEGGDDCRIGLAYTTFALAQERHCTAFKVHIRANDARGYPEFTQGGDRVRLGFYAGGANVSTPEHKDDDAAMPYTTAGHDAFDLTIPLAGPVSKFTIWIGKIGSEAYDWTLLAHPRLICPPSP